MNEPFEILQQEISRLKNWVLEIAADRDRANEELHVAVKILSIYANRLSWKEDGKVWAGEKTGDYLAKTILKFIDKED